MSVRRTCLLLTLLFIAAPAVAAPACALPVAAPGKTWIGSPLRAPVRSAERRAVLEKDLQIAQAALRIAPEREDAHLWVARRLGYLDRNAEALRVLDAALARFPDSHRVLRFRGQFHVRERNLDAAVADYTRGIALASKLPDVFEPDGVINPRNQFIGTYGSNLHYYLAQAYWGQGRYEDTLLQMLLANAHPLSHNPDRLASSVYWQYLALRRMGRHEEAQLLAAQVPDTLDLLENHGYHKAVLFFSGRLSADALLAKPDGNMRFAHAMALDFNGDRAASRAALRKLVDDTPAGYWPAETELFRMTGCIPVAG